MKEFQINLKRCDMLQTINDLPEHIVGVKAIGTVTAFDYTKTLIPLVADAYKKNGKISMLYVLGKEFEGFESSAMIMDMKLGLKYYSKWKKIAIVTDIGSLAWFAKITGFFIPGTIEIFSTQYIEKAGRWVNE